MSSAPGWVTAHFKMLICFMFNAMCNAMFRVMFNAMFQWRCFAFTGSLLTASGLLTASVIICGCSDGERQSVSGEGAAVKEAISNFSEARRNAKGFANLFADGATLDAAARKRFAPYMPSASRVSVSGNRATVDVELEELATGNIIGPTEWTLEKVGDQWKIRTCPFP